MGKNISWEEIKIAKVKPSNRMNMAVKFVEKTLNVKCDDKGNYDKMSYFLSKHLDSAKIIKKLEI